MAIIDARLLAIAMKMARDTLFCYPDYLGQDPKPIMDKFDEVADALWYGEPVTITPMPINDCRVRPPVKPLRIRDVRKAAKAKHSGCIVNGTGGNYDVFAPDGMKWDGDLHSFAVNWQEGNQKDKQAALRDVLERIENSSLIECNDED